MLPRLRPFASLAASLALMVSLTSGAWAAACMDGETEAEPRASSDVHAHGGHARHGRHAPAERALVPAPDPDRPPVPEVPGCPMMVAGGGSCVGPIAPPASAGGAGAPVTAIGYTQPAEVRVLLLASSIFRPPEA